MINTLIFIALFPVALTVGFLLARVIWAIGVDAEFKRRANNINRRINGVRK